MGAAYSILTGDKLKQDGSLGDIEISAFELPMPDLDGRDISFAKIYNAAPNLINSLADPGEVTRLYPSYNIDSALTNSVPPGQLDYLQFTSQQHSISELLKEFNPDTGFAKIYSTESSWPGSASYRGYSEFISWVRNPFYLSDVLQSGWSDEVLDASRESYPSYLSREISLLSKAEVPNIPKTIKGDNSGSIFFGGTSLGDVMTGGSGDDTYYIYGEDRITDSGGANKYYISDPQAQGAIVRDANPGDAQIFRYGKAYKGEAMPITRYVDSSLRASASGSLEYLVVSEDEEAAFLASTDSGTLKISDSLSALRESGYTSFGDANGAYSWGQFGIGKAPEGRINFASVLRKDYSVNNNNIYLFPNSIAFGDELIIISGASNIVKLNLITGTSSVISVAPINKGYLSLLGIYRSYKAGDDSFGTISSERLLDVDDDQTEDYSYRYFRMLDSNGLSICSTNVSPFPEIVYNLGRDYSRNEFLAASGSPTEFSFQCEDHTNPVKLYIVN